VRHLRRLRSGWETLCLARKNRGYSTDGGFGEYATAYARYAVQLPPGVDPFDAAPLTCAAVTTYKAIEVSGTRSSDLVTDFGVGGLGHLAIQFAGIAGGRVVAVDLVDERLEPAKELGAEFTVHAGREDPSAAIRKRRRRSGDRPLAAVVRAGLRFPQAARFARVRRAPARHRGHDREAAERDHDRRLDRRGADRPARGLRAELGGKTRVIREVPPLAEVNEAIADVEAGRVPARIVLRP